jgi:hypothetical protein
VLIRRFLKWVVSEIAKTATYGKCRTCIEFKYVGDAHVPRESIIANFKTHFYIQISVTKTKDLTGKFYAERFFF